MARDDLRRPQGGRVSAFRVGVTGHRPARLTLYDPKLLRAEVRRVLSILLQGRGPARIVSPLAEGADRIVAEEGLALGAGLVCPLPFARAEYERDFDAASRREFSALIAGREVVELPGSRATRDSADAAYEAVGLWVLGHCDALIAIWNGVAANGRGGTGQIVEEAARRGLKTAWVHVPPKLEHASCWLSWRGTGPACGKPVA